MRLFTLVIFLTILLPSGLVECYEKGVIKAIPSSIDPLHEDQKIKIMINYTELFSEVGLQIKLSNLDVVETIGINYFNLPRRVDLSKEIAFIIITKNIGRSDVIFEFKKVSKTYNTSFSLPMIDPVVVTVVRQKTFLDQMLRYISITVIYISMIMMGAEFNIKLMQRIMDKPASIGIAQVTNMLVQPLAAYLIGISLRMQSTQILYLIMVGCCPAEGNSNMMAMIMDGEVTLSFVITFMSTIMSMGWMPLNLFTYSNWLPKTEISSVDEIEIPYGRMVINLVEILIPILCGMLLRYFSPTIDKRWKTKFRYFVAASIVFNTITITFVNRFIFHFVTLKMLIACTLLPLVGFTVGALVTFIANQSTTSIRTVLFETGLQDAYLVVLIIHSLRDGPSQDLQSVIPLLTADMSHIIAIILYIIHKCAVHYWPPYKTRVEKDCQLLDRIIAEMENHEDSYKNKADEQEIDESNENFIENEQPRMNGSTTLYEEEVVEAEEEIKMTSSHKMGLVFYNDSLQSSTSTPSPRFHNNAIHSANMSPFHPLNIGKRPSAFTPINRFYSSVLIKNASNSPNTPKKPHVPIQQNSARSLQDLNCIRYPLSNGTAPPFRRVPSNQKNSSRSSSNVSCRCQVTCEGQQV